MEKPKRIFEFSEINKKAASLGLVLTAGMLCQQAGTDLHHGGQSRIFNRCVYYFCAALIGLFFRNKTQWPTWVGILHGAGGSVLYGAGG